MIALNVTLRDDDKFIARLEIINCFTRKRRSLTITQVWKMLEERISEREVGAILEDLILAGLLSHSGWTRCIWKCESLETFRYKDKAPHTEGQPDCTDVGMNSCISGRPLSLHSKQKRNI